MIAEDALTGRLATTARLVLEDDQPAIAAYVALDRREERRHPRASSKRTPSRLVAMCQR